MPLCRDLTLDKSIAWCKETLLKHPDRWPNRDWVGYPNIVTAVQELLTEAVTAPPRPPTWAIPRGVVICGGGWRFFPSVYVTVRVLRHVGCHLPIQVWYLGDAGEFDPRMRECLADCAVGWIDAHSWWRENPLYRYRLLNIDHGWMLKPFAVLGCPFREVLSLDADAYPVYNPEQFMDHPEHKRVGATFWPDNNPLQAGQWERFGIAPQDCPGLESGQFIVDKARHWAPLWAACVLNALHDFTYAHIYGDKDSFNLAWRKAGHEMCVPTKTPGWHVHTFVQKDFAGNPFILHRTRDKFRLSGDIDGQGIPAHYNTRQLTAENRFQGDLPHEAFCFEMLGLLDRTLRPDKHFDLLGHIAHLDEWKKINRENCYHFPSAFLPGEVGLDIGANLGAASVALLDRGMSKVWAVEPQAAIQTRLKANLLRYGERAVVVQAAVWSSPGRDVQIRLWPRKDDETNTGNFNCWQQNGEGELVRAVRLDPLIRMAARQGGGKVRMVKIDTEGGEYPALMTAELLDLVGEIAGEWHVVPGGCFTLRNGATVECSRDLLFPFLRAQGFDVFWESYTEDNGLFWACRPLGVPAGCCP